MWGSSNNTNFRIKLKKQAPPPTVLSFLLSIVTKKLFKKIK